MPPFTYQVTFLDNGEKQTFNDITLYEENETHHILHSESKGKMELLKDVTKVVKTGFTPFAVDPQQTGD